MALAIMTLASACDKDDFDANYPFDEIKPYASNPYGDSDRIQNDSYNNLRPGVGNLSESIDEYDVIFVGSLIWWHNPG